MLGRVGDAESFLAVVAEHEPDLAIVDVRMPPTYEDEGMRAAVEIREPIPQGRTRPLPARGKPSRSRSSRPSGGFGYLLKDRVLDVGEFLEAAERVCRGGSALEPEVVKQLLRRPREESSPPSPRASARCWGWSRKADEREHRQELWLTEKTVETHVRSILGKLDLPLDGDTHRRVLAVVTYLRASAA